MLQVTYTNAPTAAENDITSSTNITLLNEKNKPTPTAIGLIALELAVDAAIAVGIFTLLRKFGR